MPRVTPVPPGGKRLPVDFDPQILPGRVAHARGSLSDHARARTACPARDKNDDAGAAACAPAGRLKSLLLADRRGSVSRRQSAAACREPGGGIAVAGASPPPVTTLAACVAALGDLTARLLAQGLVLCARQGLLGRARCASAGGTRPSYASQANSGSRKACQRPAEPLANAARQRRDTHRDAEAAAQGASDAAREAKRRARLPKDARPIRDWLAQHPEARQGARGGGRLAHRTATASAQMAPAKGVIQGDTGVAAVEEQNPRRVEAQAHGTGAEQARRVPVVEATLRLRTPATVLPAEAGAPSDAKLRELAGKLVAAAIGDHG